MAVLIATSKKDLVDSIGISERSYTTWIAEGCPGDTKKREYSFLDVVTWARENKWSEEEQNKIEDKELMKEFDQERVRKIKYENRLLHGKAELQDSSLVSVDVIENWLRVFSKRIRGALETLQKQFGVDAYRLVANEFDRIDEELASGGAIDISRSN